MVKDAAVRNNTAHIIVFGNEKGGSGKSTSAMHVAIGLLRLGYKVGSIDLDARQGTFSRYLKNRFDFVTTQGRDLPSPLHMAIEKSAANNVEDQQEEERNFLTLAMLELGLECDFLIIDTPGSDTYLSRLAHSYADTLITPMNDSFVDLDVIARINPESHDVEGPSIYTKMVDAQRAQKRLRGGGNIDWIVMRNRLSHVNARNKRDIERILKNLSMSFDFRIAHGLGERVVFRELFLKGLTLLDLKEDPDNSLTLSQLSARQEVRQLILEINPEKYKPNPRFHKNKKY